MTDSVAAARPLAQPNMYGEPLSVPNLQYII